VPPQSPAMDCSPVASGSVAISERGRRSDGAIPPHRLCEYTMKNLVITVLVDNADSWILPYVEELIATLSVGDHDVHFARHHGEIERGDVAFLLSCGSIVPKETLSLNRHNVVVHESALPMGKGWSPLTWQILEGKNEIPITMFEAVERVDAGPVFFQDLMVFEGHELLHELRDVQGRKTIELCLRFIESYPEVGGVEQRGDESFYPRRRPDDSKVDVDESILELFNRFRVADNIRYPVFFEHLGYRYVLKIEKVGRAPPSEGLSG